MYNFAWKTLTGTLTYIDSCHAVDRINYSLVTQVNRQTHSDVMSDVYFDVAMKL